MSGRTRPAIIRFAVFAVVMVLITAGLVVVFGQYRTGSTQKYSAVFTDASGLKPGDTVRIAGIRVGTVEGVRLGQSDHIAHVDFDAGTTAPLTGGTRAQVRYLNLVGDRYLELTDGPGPGTRLAPGSTIPVSRTAPALDLDLLLGGFKPLIRALDPEQTNKLTASLLQVLQGQGGTLVSLLSDTSSFTSTLADNDRLIGDVIANLRSVLTTISDKGDQFSTTLTSLETLVSGLAKDRDPIGSAISAIDVGTGSVADLLTEARPSLAGSIDQLNALAPQLDAQKAIIDDALQKGPTNFKKLARLGSYGSFFNFYLCGITLRITGADGQPVTLPWIKQATGRCAS